MDNPPDDLESSIARVPPGAGLTKCFLKFLLQKSPSGAALPQSVLLVGYFTSEGDNLYVAMELAKAVNDIVGLGYPSSVDAGK